MYTNLTVSPSIETFKKPFKHKSYIDKAKAKQRTEGLQANNVYYGLRSHCLGPDFTSLPSLIQGFQEVQIWNIQIIIAFLYRSTHVSTMFNSYYYIIL